jgi:archaellum biogenesis ATPase FlaH
MINTNDNQNIDTASDTVEAFDTHRPLLNAIFNKGILRGEVALVMGDRGAGKTESLMCIAARHAARGKKVLFVSIGGDPQVVQHHLNRGFFIASIDSAVPPTVLPTVLHHAKEASAVQILDEVAMEVVTGHLGVDIVIIDNIDASRYDDETERQMDDFTVLCHELNVVGFASCHVDKEDEYRWLRNVAASWKIVRGGDGEDAYVETQVIKGRMMDPAKPFIIREGPVIMRDGQLAFGDRNVRAATMKEPGPFAYLRIDTDHIEAMSIRRRSGN